MPEEKLLSNVDGAEMFSSALEEQPPPIEEKPQEPTGEPSGEEKSEPRTDTAGRLHGQDGRFVPKQAKEADAAPTQQPPAGDKPPATQTPHEPEAMVPSWRLREEREQREAAIRRAEDNERRAQDLERRFLDIQRQQQPQQQPEIDPLTDPQGYAQMMQGYVTHQLARMQLNQSLELARVRHGEGFDEAFDAFMQVAERDQRFGQAVVGSANPGDTLWKWYQGQLILREVGTDPTTYKQKLRDDLLKDPAFQAEVIKAVNAASQQQSATRPQNITQLPPSLNRAAGSGGNTPETAPTGEELFNHALRG